MRKLIPNPIKSFLKNPKKFLKKLFGYSLGNTIPSREFIEKFELLKKQKINLRVAEIGVDRGASSIEIIKRMHEGDILDLYDREKAPFF